MDNGIWLRIATDFSEIPGGRGRDEGDHSGEEFREEHLEPRFAEALERGAILYVDLDGVEGYATSFLEEAFGGLTRKYSGRLTSGAGFCRSALNARSMRLMFSISLSRSFSPCSLVVS